MRPDKKKMQENINRNVSELSVKLNFEKWKSLYILIFYVPGALYYSHVVK